jgi:hypothetical protein
VGICSTVSSVERTLEVVPAIILTLKVLLSWRVRASNSAHARNVIDLEQLEPGLDGLPWVVADVVGEGFGRTLGAAEGHHDFGQFQGGVLLVHRFVEGNRVGRGEGRLGPFSRNCQPAVARSACWTGGIARASAGAAAMIARSVVEGGALIRKSG